ncbi:MAG: hypothetical protein DWQ07_24025 [Chloroflexi bacterium]|nr:MAG: hypothetical protein DWQ07_24025 [Chloroflexota bacterium]MBL1194217.1 hypothetical protein [Chloroflexota bacterium]NOH11510.1 hypothetical protein [Chloroflexota bacterium]
MAPLLMIAALILMEWLLVVAEITGELQFYFWAFLIVVLWNEAIRARSPNQFPNRMMGIAYLSIFFVTLLLFNKSFIYVQQNGLPLPGGDALLPTPTPPIN